VALTRGSGCTLARVWVRAIVSTTRWALIIVVLVGASTVGGNTAYAGTALNVRVTDVRDVAAIVSWTSSVTEAGKVEYGAAVNGSCVASAYGTTAIDVRGSDTASPVHYVKLENLSPSTLYCFRPVSGSVTGSSSTFTTGPTLELGASDSVYGTVTFDGATASDVIMYVTLSNNGVNSSEFSVIIKPLDAGYFVLNLQGARSLGNSTYFAYTDTSKMSITLEGGVKGVGSATTTVGAIRSAAGSSSTPFSLAVSAAPTVASITPNYIWPGGGTLLTITGSNFFAGTMVTIGSLPATEVTVVSSTQLTAKSPAKSKFGDTNNSNAVNATDSLCVLRAVAKLPSTAGCPTSGLNSPMDVTVVATNGMTATLAGGVTMRNADMNNSGAAVASGTLAGVNATDSLCILRLVARLPATTGCPRPVVTASVAAASVGARSIRPAPPAFTIVIAPRIRPTGSDAMVVDLQAQVPTGGSLGAWNFDLDVPSPLRLAPSEGTPSLSVLQASVDGRQLRVVGASLDVGTGTTTLATIVLTGAESLSSSAVLSSSVAEPDALTDVGGSIVAAVLEPATVEARGSPTRAEPEPVRPTLLASSERPASVTPSTKVPSGPDLIAPTANAPLTATPVAAQQPQVVPALVAIGSVAPALADQLTTLAPEWFATDAPPSLDSSAESAALQTVKVSAVWFGTAATDLGPEFAAMLTEALAELPEDRVAAIVAAIIALDTESLKAILQSVANLPVWNRAEALISTVYASLHPAEVQSPDIDRSFGASDDLSNPQTLNLLELDESSLFYHGEMTDESVENDLQDGLCESEFIGVSEVSQDDSDEANGESGDITSD
jgi:hypothetical protein